MTETTASLDSELFDDLLEECIFELALSVTRDARLASRPCQVCGKNCRDISHNRSFHQRVDTLEPIVCPECGRQHGAQKFAQHLEKCLGLGPRGTRQAARDAASRFTSDVGRPASPYAEWSSDSGSEGSTETGKRRNGKRRTSPHKGRPGAKRFRERPASPPVPVSWRCHQWDEGSTIAHLRPHYHDT
ncbi:hypothetical protein M427DRAFT_189269 [Gonapodya prolifera JEL478]|uniref:SAGA-associated factor 11 n=1 Tax=Gonapodya prolifera (strain JEL478) TaxID=1344416 RepID=A0A139A1D7_GONPJ|nr:hypothetical protein M427DRAFT_189269 [Gonapodya prolifera JEL478]|eukprot:KXS10173.1 hypothetical protein M427DRAFT_189269 [Gonapodya prolifera JEL478]